VRIVLCDDHPVFRDGMRLLLTELGHEVVAEAATGEEAIERAVPGATDIVVMDLHLPGISGVEAIQAITRADPAIGILVLTMLDDDATLIAALRAGPIRSPHRRRHRLGREASSIFAFPAFPAISAISAKMPRTIAAMFTEIVFGIVAAAVFFGSPLALMCGSVIFAARSALLYKEQLKRGAILSAVAIAILASIAMATHADTHYDDMEGMYEWVGTIAGALLLCGLGPSVPLLLSGVARFFGRSPSLLRRAVRDVTGPLGRSSAWIAVTMNATALAVALPITASAVTAQNRAEYVPSARLGALSVNVSGPDLTAVRAAIAQELPGVPVAEKDWGLLNVHVSEKDQVYSFPFIGDEALLRYLTGDFTTPYDSGKAILIMSDAPDVDHVRIEPVRRRYDIPEPLPPDLTIPASSVEPRYPGIEGIFLPATAVGRGGFEMSPSYLIVDPSLHRTSEAELERLTARLGDDALYLEQGYRPSAIWRWITAAAILLSLMGAVAAASPRRSPHRPASPPPPAEDPPPASPRRDAAARAMLAAVCGVLIGAAAGCFIGVELRWPATISFGWEPFSRVPFTIPWRFILALLLGIPALTATVAALLARRRPTPALSSAG
jgi:CheY-like chemotaxis protein